MDGFLVKMYHDVYQNIGFVWDLSECHLQTNLSNLSNLSICLRDSTATSLQPFSLIMAALKLLLCGFLSDSCD